ncbi:endonuclease III [Candidatus Saccharibacteria bacterium]|uniref:Endonuclease III n=1 Tax=candidate division WWE3 bacterium TaxID=2053526 RepID=A0A955EFH2_UNCKA|nr:endonuclease III [candidate division WWE3 bacterium]MCA9346949.1 endonuclease III [Candidatus Saccharibacteria bacterium]
MSKKELAKEIVALLRKNYPNARIELDYTNERELAVAVVLSAQTTDKKVNEITAKLFKKYSSWEDYATADLNELTETIKGVNFHKGKAERLVKMGEMMVSEYKGKLPNTIEELTKLPGVARKTANVLTHELWGKAYGVVVDTHITRLSNLWGFTKEQNAVKIEKDLIALLDKEDWITYSRNVVLHGRYVCKARKPDCANCVLNEVCPSAFNA